MISTEQTPAGANYVPTQSRDHEFIARFAGKKGSRMAWQERVGAQASALMFREIIVDGKKDDLKSAANILGFVTMGSAYHHYVEGSDDVMARRVRLPIIMDPETGDRTSSDELIAQTSIALDIAVDIARRQEEAAFDQVPFRDREVLGRHLAVTSLKLAAVEHHVGDLELDAVRTQQAAWSSARNLQIDLVNFTNTVGYRPTLAQIGDRQSPLWRHIEDTPDFLTKHVYGALDEATDFASDQQ